MFKSVFFLFIAKKNSHTIFYQSRNHISVLSGVFSISIASKLVDNKTSLDISPPPTHTYFFVQIENNKHDAIENKICCNETNQIPDQISPLASASVKRNTHLQQNLLLTTHTDFQPHLLHEHSPLQEKKTEQHFYNRNN